jgi:hypothetical protein
LARAGSAGDGDALGIAAAVRGSALAAFVALESGVAMKAAWGECGSRKTQKLQWPTRRFR